MHRALVVVAVMLVSACGVSLAVDGGTGGAGTGGGSASTGGGNASTGGGNASTGGGMNTGGGNAGGGGGSDAGVDAGSDAGVLPQRCVTGGECTGDAGTAACGAQQMSCIDGQCLADCAGPRSCVIDAGASCITCGATTTCSTFSGCIGGLASYATLIIQSATCTAWPDGGAFAGSQVFIATSASGCVSTIARADGGAPEGRVTVLDDFSLLGDFPGLGGGCVVNDTTGAPHRWVVSCPACQFVLTNG